MTDYSKQLSYSERESSLDLISWYKTNSYEVDILVPDKSKDEEAFKEIKLMIPKLPHHQNVQLIKWTMTKFIENADWTNA